LCDAIYYALTPLHLGKFGHLQNMLPVFAPRFAVLANMSLPQVGQVYFRADVIHASEFQSFRIILTMG
jgi:hypothetical protein